MIPALPPPGLPPTPPALFEQYGGRTIPAPPANPFSGYGGHVLYPGFEAPNTITFSGKLAGLFKPYRYKVLEGGRGSMKSWSVARALILQSLQRPLRILCAREYMASIEDSVHKLLCDQIEAMGLSPWFKITKSSIRTTNGSEFKFIGLSGMSGSNRSIKSLEGFDRVWIEEAEGISERTWEVLIPTIRKAGSEIWIVYNPNLATDSTYKRFHDNPPPNCLVIKMNWRDNPWLSDELKAEKDHLFAVDPEAAAHVWDGELRQHAKASILGDKYIVHAFETPADAIFYHGADWGFSQDPTTLIRMFITGSGLTQELWIDYEAYGVGVDIDKTPELFDKVPTARKWKITADSARPETISYMKNQGFNIVGVEKWDGCVEDGIAHLRRFVKIHIHTRCHYTAQEFKLYSFKVDRNTEEVLPIVVDKHNHCIDGCRYGLDKFIKRGGVAGRWAALAR